MLFAARYGEKRPQYPVHFHYVAPSFWAWKGGEERLKNLATFVDHILCILPNEDVVCRSNGLGATFVGHPIVEDCFEFNSGKDIELCSLQIEGNCEDFRNKYSVPSGATVITLLPGSRLQEVRRMLPIFARTMARLKDSISELTAVIHVAPNLHVENYINRVISKWSVPAILIPGGSTRLKYDAFSASRIALCTSGTVAVEMQVAQLPCVVAYRAHLLTEWFIRYKAKIPYISLPNILLDSPVIPEVLFRACTPDTLATLLRELIHDEGLRKKQIVSAEKVIRFLIHSDRTVDDSGKQDKRWILADKTPSMIAARTILGYVKSQDMKTDV